jgi:hypothetical protein
MAVPADKELQLPHLYVHFQAMSQLLLGRRIYYFSGECHSIQSYSSKPFYGLIRQPYLNLLLDFNEILYSVTKIGL